MKALKKLGIERSCLNIIKAMYNKPTVSLKSGTRQGCLLSLLLLNVVIELLALAIRQAKLA
jgi:hypothetical protein